MQIQTELHAGSAIGRYRVIMLLGVGGFGITYKAFDTSLQRIVAIKEFFPHDVAVRSQDSQNVLAVNSLADEYRYGLERFLEEAKTVAHFKHPNIVTVLDYLQANNTAYLIMDYEPGQTLMEFLKQEKRVLTETELRSIFGPILAGLEHIHEREYFHRDIKPGNIYLRQKGEPMLIDFGAARQAIGVHSRNVTSIVSAGYAPTEQYGTDSKKLGPWSDLYSLGATLYHCISGEKPIDAPTRRDAIMDEEPDPLIPAVVVGQNRYSQNILELIDWMMRPSSRDRPKSVKEVWPLWNSQAVTDSDMPTVIVKKPPVASGFSQAQRKESISASRPARNDIALQPMPQMPVKQSVEISNGAINHEIGKFLTTLKAFSISVYKPLLWLTGIGLIGWAFFLGYQYWQNQEKQQIELMKKISGKWTLSDCQEASTWNISDKILTEQWPDIGEVQSKILEIGTDFILVDVILPEQYKGKQYRYQLIGEDLEAMEISSGRKGQFKRCL